LISNVLSGLTEKINMKISLYAAQGTSNVPFVVVVPNTPQNHREKETAANIPATSAPGSTLLSEMEGQRIELR
jgi:hypothetical protein